MKTQKFFRGHRVKVDRSKDTSYTPHPPIADEPFEAIVIGSYYDECGNDSSGEDDVNNFKVCILNNGKASHVLSWFHDSTFTLISNDRDAGEQILQEYRLTRNRNRYSFK